MPTILIGVAAAIFILLLRVLWVLYEVQCHRTAGRVLRKPTAPLRTLVVLGSGGHTTEMLTMTQTLDDTIYHPMVFCKASTDSTSHDRLCTFRPGSAISVYNIPRSREVGQSFSSSIPSTLWAMGASMRLVYRIRPDVILCNGPGTCIPICLTGFLLRICGIHTVTVVFVESFCRVLSLSLTGKLLYGIADVFLVHWKSLQTRFPQTTLTSAIVQQHAD